MTVRLLIAALLCCALGYVVGVISSSPKNSDAIDISTVLDEVVDVDGIDIVIRSVGGGLYQFDNTNILNAINKPTSNNARKALISTFSKLSSLEDSRVARRSLVALYNLLINNGLDLLGPIELETIYNDVSKIIESCGDSQLILEAGSIIRLLEGQ